MSTMLEEKCQNPFFKCKSRKPNDIKVYIVYKGKKLPICADCWSKLSELDVEWGGEDDASQV